MILRRPIAVTMCIIALVVLGLLTASKLPVGLMPDIEVPQITVQVSCPGYAAPEVERQYIGTLRGQLTQVDGVVSLRSESRADAGNVRLTFDPGQNMDLLFIAVNEKLDRAMHFMPPGSDRPKVIKAGAMDIPAFYLDVYLKDTTARSPERFAQLCRFVQGVVSKRVEQLPQTAMVDLSGTVGSEIVCIPYVDKLTALGLTEQDLESAISRSNLRLDALSVEDGIFRYHVHFDAQLLTKEDVAGVYLHHGGRLLQLRDLCSLEERMQTPTGLVRHNGQRALTLAIIKQSDARMEDLRGQMQVLLKDLRQEYPQVEFQLTRDQTELLSYTLKNLRSNLLVGALLASLILWVFMRQWRLSLLVVLSIPLSLLFALLGFGLFGVSMNIISLSGLILGVGMIVDNSIIVIDNMVRRRQGGEALDRATLQGTREVFTPMLSSVLTTCSVFLPLIFLSGTAGALFFDQAVGVSLSLFASLVVAAVVVPVYFFALYKGKPAPSAAPAPRHRGLYARTLAHVLRHSRVYLLLGLLCLPLSLWLFNRIEKERIPALPRHDALLYIDWNAGISATENDRRVTGLMQAARGLWQEYTSLSGVQAFLLPHTPELSQSEAVVYVAARDARSLQALQTRVTAQLQARHPQATLQLRDAGNIFSLLFSPDQPDLEIRLQDLRGQRPPLTQSRRMIDTLRQHFPQLTFSPVEVEADIRLVADREHLALHGVSYEALYRRLMTLVNQGRVMEINDGAQSVPILLGTQAYEAEGLLTQTVTNAQGTPVPLHQLVHRTQGEDYKRLEAGVAGPYYNIAVHAPDREVEKLMAFMNRYVRDGRSGLMVSFDGAYFSARKLIRELFLVLAVALALLYFILAAQFESLAQPLIILLEMVVDVFFVLLALRLLGMSLNVMSMIGLVVVSGIVINDSILKVDTINRLRRNGSPLLPAIVRAGHWRLRPIVMTSLTTILALVPFLFQQDMGSALQRPLSLTVIVGMSVGTLVSLFFIPMLYSLIERAKQRRA